MAATLAFPFRVHPGGRLATVEQGTADSDAQLLQALLLTRLGERPLQPGFGIADPLFAAVDRSQIEAGIAAYGPDVDVTDVTVQAADGGNVRVTITFE